MAVKGTKSKEQIAETILATFPGSFRYDKELRIPMMEDGELVQVKVTLTAAKSNVENNESSVILKNAEPVSTLTEPTAEEKQTVVDLIQRLGL
jgi:hypothetical protein